MFLYLLNVVLTLMWLFIFWIGGNATLNWIFAWWWLTLNWFVLFTAVQSGNPLGYVWLWLWHWTICSLNFLFRSFGCLQGVIHMFLKSLLHWSNYLCLASCFFFFFLIKKQFYGFKSKKKKGSHTSVLCLANCYVTVWYIVFGLWFCDYNS